MHRIGERSATEVVNARVKLSAGIREAFNQDGAVLLDIEQGLCLSLNVVGAKIWQMLKDGCSGELIVAALETEFSAIPRDQLQQDFVEFVRQLEAKKLAYLEAKPDQQVSGKTAA
jgi:hypothetical protein